MNAFAVTTIPVYYAMAIAYILLRRHELASPATVFVITQLLMYTGILGYIDQQNNSDCKLLIFYLCSLVFFIGGSMLRRGPHLKDNKEFTLDELNQYQIEVILFLIAISVILSTYLFARNGGNAFVQSIKALYSGEEANVVNLRFGYNQVRGIGYISQFRGVILPVLNMLLIINRRKKKLYVLGLVLAPISIVLLLGTGQRGQFAILACILFTYLLLQRKYLGYRFNAFKLTVCALSIFILFSVLTISNGRIASSDNNLVIGVINAFVKRIMNDNQSCAVIGFRYIDSLPTVWGYDWFMSLLDLLPGKNSYISMEARIFALIYGSTRGTSPPCIWGSAYYNWSLFGITLFPFILGFLYEGCYVDFCMSKKSDISILMFSAESILMGYWIASTPMYLVNDGLLTIMILGLLLQKRESQNDILPVKQLHSA